MGEKDEKIRFHFFGFFFFFKNKQQTIEKKIKKNHEIKKKRQMQQEKRTDEKEWKRNPLAIHIPIRIERRKGESRTKKKSEELDKIKQVRTGGRFIFLFLSSFRS